MAQGLVTEVGAQELPIQTVRFFAGPIFLHEVSRCHGGGSRLFDSPKQVAFEVKQWQLYCRLMLHIFVEK